MDEFKLEVGPDVGRRKVPTEEVAECDDDGEIRLMPPEEIPSAMGLAHRVRIRAVEQEPEEADAGAKKYQFSLADMFVLTTVIAVGLAGARWSRGGFFPFAMALAGIAFLFVSPTELRCARRIGVILLIIYGTASLATIFGIGS